MEPQIGGGGQGNRGFDGGSGGQICLFDFGSEFCEEHYLKPQISVGGLMGGGGGVEPKKFRKVMEKIKNNNFKNPNKTLHINRSLENSKGRVYNKNQ